MFPLSVSPSDETGGLGFVPSVTSRSLYSMDGSTYVAPSSTAAFKEGFKVAVEGPNMESASGRLLSDF